MSPRVWAGLFLALCSFRGVAQDNSLAEQSHQAKDLMAAGRFEEAIPIYQKLVIAVPGNPGLMLNLGLAEQMAGHPEKAIPQFQSVLKIQPDNVPALTSMAMSELQMNQPGPAVAPLRKLAALQPDNRDVHGMLAGALLATDHAEDAAAQYRKLCALDGRDAKAWYGLGSAYEAAANTTFDRLTKLAVSSPYWAALVAESRLQRGQYRSAFFFYRNAAEAMPTLHGVHAGLAQVYRKTGHDDWASTEDRRESEISSAACTTKTAACYFRAGKFLDAVQLPGPQQPEALFWKTKALNSLAIEAFSHLGSMPESPELHAVKADILKSHGQYAESAKEWRAALQLAPGDEKLNHELMTALFLARDYDALIPMLQTAVREHANSPDLNYMLGDSLLQTEHPDDAVPFLETALRDDPRLTMAHRSLGFALSRTGRAQDAIPHLEQSLATDKDGSARYQLARAYQAAGQADKSREMMSQYQSITTKNQAAQAEVAKEAEIVPPTR